MSDSPASTPAPGAGPTGPPAAAGDALANAFADMKEGLGATLDYLLGKHEDAQDAAQEAFLKCWRARNSLPEVRNLQAWIYRIALNAARDLRRNSWRRRARALSGPPLCDNAGGNSPPVVCQ